MDNDAVQALRARSEERRARLVAQGAESIADHLSFGELILGRVRERVLAGELEPTIAEGLKAAQLVAQAAPPDDVDQDAVFETMMIYVRAAKEVLQPEQLRALSDRITRDKKWARASGATPPLSA